MTLRLHRRDESGLVRVVPDRREDWRTALRSGSWADRRGRPRRIANPDQSPTPPLVAALLLCGLGLLTFALLVVLRGSGVWA